MDGHPYQYKVMVEYVSPEQKGKYPHFTHIEEQEGLAITLDAAFARLPESIPTGWEVISHDIAVSRNTLVITILLRRPVST